MALYNLASDVAAFRCEKNKTNILIALIISPTLLCSIVLVGLTVPLPDIAINIIKIVRGNIGDAVELEEIGLCDQSPEQRQEPLHVHRGGDWSETVKTRLGKDISFPSPIYEHPAVCGRPEPSGGISSSPSLWMATRALGLVSMCSAGGRALSSARLEWVRYYYRIQIFIDQNLFSATLCL